jgi:hypothetical protein
MISRQVHHAPGGFWAGPQAARRWVMTAIMAHRTMASWLQRESGINLFEYMVLSRLSMAPTGRRG